MKKVTIADEREKCQAPTKLYSEAEAVTMCGEFVALVKEFCEKHHTALIGELLFSAENDRSGMLFVMQGAVPEREEVEQALVAMLGETTAFYREHEDAR